MYIYALHNNSKRKPSYRNITDFAFISNSSLTPTLSPKIEVPCLIKGLTLKVRVFSGGSVAPNNYREELA